MALKALRVLILEDEALIALLFEDVLAEMGHTVCGSVRTAAAAIATAAQCRPDLIIADVRLQDGSGIDAVATILETGFTPHIFVSGDVLDKAMLHPAAAILQKPFGDRQLMTAIASALSVAEAPTARMDPDSLRRARWVATVVDATGGEVQGELIDTPLDASARGGSTPGSGALESAATTMSAPAHPAILRETS